jgi:hypothetical protein
MGQDMLRTSAKYARQLARSDPNVLTDYSIFKI